MLQHTIDTIPNGRPFRKLPKVCGGGPVGGVGGWRAASTTCHLPLDLSGGGGASGPLGGVPPARHLPPDLYAGLSLNDSLGRPLKGGTPTCISLAASNLCIACPLLAALLHGGTRR